MAFAVPCKDEEDGWADEVKLACGEGFSLPVGLWERDGPFAGERSWRRSNVVGEKASVATCLIAGAAVLHRRTLQQREEGRFVW